MEVASQLARQRAKMYAYLDDVPGVSKSTVWRIEHAKGKFKRESAESYLGAISSDLSLLDAFEPDDPYGGEGPYTWGQVEAAAKVVGGRLFKWGANIILTFSGHSWIFASIVLAVTLEKDRDRLLSIPVYVAPTMDWEPSKAIPERPGFVSLPALEPDEETKRYGLAVLMPKDFPEADRKHKRRVAVIDDSISSGVVPPAVRKYLWKSCRYRKEDVKLDCCVCVKNVMLGEAERQPDYPAPLQPETSNFSFPWGHPIWFPRP